MPPALARLARLGGALAAAALLLVACRTPVTPAASSPTLHLLLAPIDTLDPAHVAAGDATMVDRAVFSGLVRYDAQGHLAPDLAASWSVSADRTVYTFTLRPHATFHNGDPVTAASIVYAINRACDPASGSPVAADYLGPIRGVAERLAGRDGTVSGVAAEGSQTVRFTLTHPDDAFLARLTFPLTFALDQKTVEAGGANWWQHPNGSGPFRLTSWQPDRALTLERVAAADGPAPHLAAVVLHNPSALGDLSQAFGGGTLDLLPVPPQVQQLAAFLDPGANIPPELRADLHIFDYAGLQYLVLDASAPPFDDPLVRQAANAALDKWALVAGAMGGDGWPAAAILPPQFAGYDPAFRPYPTNPALARALLGRSRYGNVPQRLSLASGEPLVNGQPAPLPAAVATLFRQALGWDVQVRYVPQAQLDDALAAGTPPASMSLAGWQADYLDEQDFLGLLFHSGRRSNLAHYHNARVDQLLDAADQEADPGRRRALYTQAQEQIMRDAPIVPLFYDRGFALLSPRVASLPLLPDGTFDLLNSRTS